MLLHLSATIQTHRVQKQNANIVQLNATEKKVRLGVSGMNDVFVQRMNELEKRIAKQECQIKCLRNTLEILFSGKHQIGNYCVGCDHAYGGPLSISGEYKCGLDLKNRERN